MGKLDEHMENFTNHMEIPELEGTILKIKSGFHSRTRHSGRQDEESGR